jgi:hypothetical protein
MSTADQPQPTDHPHPQPAHTGKSRRRWLNALVFGVIVGGLAAGGVWLFLPKAKDTATSTIKINTVAPAKSLIAQAKSRFVLNAVFRKQPELAKLGTLQAPGIDPVEALEKIMKVEYLGSGLLNIAVTGDNSHDLEELSIALADAFVEEVLANFPVAWEFHRKGEITHGNDVKLRTIATNYAAVGGFLLVFLCAGVMEIRSRMAEPEIVAYLENVDGSIRPIYEDGKWQYVINNNGVRVYVYLVPRDESDLPVIVPTKRGSQDE